MMTIALIFAPFRLSLPPLLVSLYLPAEGGVDDGHHGGEQAEEGVGQVGEGGNAKHGGLGHAAGVPWDEYGNHGGAVLGGA